jgi:hypothetical protein
MRVAFAIALACVCAPFSLAAVRGSIGLGGTVGQRPLFDLAQVLDTNHRTIDNAVGPIYYGEGLNHVFHILGKSSESTYCFVGTKCTELRYTDGANLLLLDYSKTDGVEMIRVYRHASSKSAAVLPGAFSPLASWHWHGAPILNWPPPTSVQGWERRGGGSMVSFSYGHPCEVSFEKTQGRPAFEFYCE